MKNKTILVTGAGGFVGSHLVEQLLKMGCNVKAFVRYNSRNDIGLLSEIPPAMRGKLEIIAGDLRDMNAVAFAMKDCQIIFHLGALIAIPYSYQHPREVIDTNVMGALNVLTAARDHQVEKVVHTSTSEVYGTARYVPIDENHPLQGQSPYSASKISADKIAESFHLSFDLPVATVRPFNIYGPRQSARAVIPTIITQLLTGKIIKLGAISPTRDFTYVLDTVNGFIRVAESENTLGQTFNIGSDFEISIGDLALKIAKLMNTDIEIVTDETRLRPEKSEVDRLWAHNEKAKSTFDWQSEYTLEDGLNLTIDWIKGNLDRFHIGAYVR